MTIEVQRYRKIVYHLPFEFLHHARLFLSQTMLCAFTAHPTVKVVREPRERIFKRQSSSHPSTVTQELSSLSPCFSAWLSLWGWYHMWHLTLCRVRDGSCLMGFLPCQEKGTRGLPSSLNYICRPESFACKSPLSFSFHKQRDG